MGKHIKVTNEIKKGLSPMKGAKTRAMGGFVLIILLFAIGIRLPLTIRYPTEIRLGNQFVENLKQYQRQHHKLPQEQEHEMVDSLRPEELYEPFYPQYGVRDSVHFVLTYIQGFDGPYLTYDSQSNQWEMRF